MFDGAYHDDADDDGDDNDDVYDYHVDVDDAHVQCNELSFASFFSTIRYRPKAKFRFLAPWSLLATPPGSAFPLFSFSLALCGFEQ